MKMYLNTIYLLNGSLLPSALMMPHIGYINIPHFTFSNYAYVLHEGQAY